eukprot:SAG11_NODE_5116_length_1658_cov_24.830019_2_plen_366_part_01
MLPAAAVRDATFAPTRAGQDLDEDGIARAYERHGFVVLQSLFSDADLAPITAQITAKVDKLIRQLPARGAEPPEAWAGKAEEELECRIPALAPARDVGALDFLHAVAPFRHATTDAAELATHRGLVTNPRLLRAAAAILGTPVYYSYAGICRAKLPRAAATSRATVPTTLHQDSQYFDSVDPTFSGGEVRPGLPHSTARLAIVSVWVSLVDVGGEIGSLTLIPGSHRGGALYAGRRDAHGNMGSLIDIERQLGRAVEVAAPKGTAVLCVPPPPAPPPLAARRSLGRVAAQFRTSASTARPLTGAPSMSACPSVLPMEANGECSDPAWCRTTDRVRWTVDWRYHSTPPAAAGPAAAAAARWWARCCA